MANPEFTLEQALAVQADQLRHWKKLLKPHVYEMLKEEFVENGEDLKYFIEADNSFENKNYEKESIVINTCFGIGIFCNILQKG